jgi:hypothetical protein
MLKPLYETLKHDHDVYITSRDFDSTFYLLDKYNLPHIRIGKHGGGSRLGKLKAYNERLKKLINITVKYKTDFLFCLASPEALRIAYGLAIPNIVFNDEPRSVGVVKLTLPIADQVIVPKCIPLEWYTKYIGEEKLIRFHGIDEVGWLTGFSPNSSVLNRLKLEKEKYVICRTEPTKAQYIADKMKPHQTQLVKILPDLLEHSYLKFIIITRYKEQLEYLQKYFKNQILKNRIRICEALENLDDFLFFAKTVISGGGTIVRESSLLGVPSIEYFPLDTYPQEQFLMDNGFPLKHIKNSSEVVEATLKYLEGNYRIDTKDKIKALENPIEIALDEFEKRNLKFK